jgi:hypothetical protein
MAELGEDYFSLSFNFILLTNRYNTRCVVIHLKRWRQVSPIFPESMKKVPMHSNIDLKYIPF